MIDWMNPSDDVLDARRIGYQEAMQECAENAEALRAELNEAADATGIAGVDNPMSLLECIQSLRRDRDSRRCPQCDELRLELGDARRDLNKANQTILGMRLSMACHCSCLPDAKCWSCIVLEEKED